MCGQASLSQDSSGGFRLVDQPGHIALRARKYSIIYFEVRLRKLPEYISSAKSLASRASHHGWLPPDSPSSQAETRSATERRRHRIASSRLRVEAGSPLRSGVSIGCVSEGFAGDQQRNFDQLRRAGERKNNLKAKPCWLFLRRIACHRDLCQGRCVIGFGPSLVLRGWGTWLLLRASFALKLRVRRVTLFACPVSETASSADDSKSTSRRKGIFHINTAIRTMIYSIAVGPREGRRARREAMRSGAYGRTRFPASSILKNGL